MPSIFSKEDKERIRTQLLAEGREMMLERGITKMNIDELAESAGIAKGTFYNFFPSKQDFILEIIHSYQDGKLAQHEQFAADKKGKITLNEAFEWYKTLYQPQENPLYHVSKKDMDWIMAKIPPERLFRPEVDIRTGRLILSMIEGVREDIDYQVLANFPKMMALALENKDFMHQEALETNFQMIVDCMYLFNLKGKGNEKLGTSGNIDSNWINMPYRRFNASISVAFLGDALIGFGFYSLVSQMKDVNSGLAAVTAVCAYVSVIAEFFIHTVLCIQPIIYKKIMETDNFKLADDTLEAYYKAVIPPFLIGDVRTDRDCEYALKRSCPDFADIIPLK